MSENELERCIECGKYPKLKETVRYVRKGLFRKSEEKQWQVRCPDDCRYVTSNRSEGMVIACWNDMMKGYRERKEAVDVLIYDLKQDSYELERLAWARLLEDIREIKELLVRMRKEEK